MLKNVFLVAPDRSTAIIAYTEEEPNIYNDATALCRQVQNDAKHDTMMNAHRDFLYFFDDGLKCMPSYNGWCYRCIDVLLPEHWSPAGKRVTFQAPSSASRVMMESAKFLNNQGRKLTGTLLKLLAKTARDVSSLSRYPFEEEVVFPLNSHFDIIKHIEYEQEKRAELPDLSFYDMTDLLVIIAEQV